MGGVGVSGPPQVRVLLLRQHVEQLRDGVGQLLHGAGAVRVVLEVVLRTHPCNTESVSQPDLVTTQRGCHNTERVSQHRERVTTQRACHNTESVSQHRERVTTQSVSQHRERVTTQRVCQTSWVTSCIAVCRAPSTCHLDG